MIQPADKKLEDSGVALCPKFTGGYIAEDEQAIWGYGESRAECLKSAKYWLRGGQDHGPVDFSEHFKLIPSSERAVAATMERGADASRDIVLIDNQYYHKDEVSGPSEQ